MFRRPYFRVYMYHGLRKSEYFLIKHAVLFLFYNIQQLVFQTPIMCTVFKRVSSKTDLLKYFDALTTIFFKG